MTALPTRIDRMPDQNDTTATPEWALAMAINLIPRAFWEECPFSDESRTVQQIRKNLEVCGFEIVRKKI